MTLLESTPALIMYRQETHHSWNPMTLAHSTRTDEVKAYAWQCKKASADDATTPSTHEGTYATGDWLLDGAQIDIPHGKEKGLWIEFYRAAGAWAEV